MATLSPIQDPIQDQALPLVLRSLVSFNLEVPQCVFSDIGIFAECRQVVWENVLKFGFIWCFLMTRSKLYPPAHSHWEWMTFCLGWRGYLTETWSQRRDQNPPHPPQGGRGAWGNSVHQGSGVNSSFVGPGPAARQRAGRLCRCPEGTRASRSLAISGLGTKSLWK